MASQDSLDYWKTAWEKNNTKWHMQDRHPYLEKYTDILLNGRKDVQIFFPMCGKCVDMKWFYDNGHRVVGVEYVEKAVKEFFQEQGLEYVVEPVEQISGNIYKTADGRMKIFCCEILKFNRDCAGLMDVVWDRGALVAIEKTDRKIFVKLMLSILAPGYRYLLSGFCYDDWFYSGCPRTVPPELVHILFGNHCNLQHLETRDASESMSERTDVSPVLENFWLITERNL
ncbi:thiopurine S-methyltransferase-like isoform X1 [Tachypleus tridentatus]|uniref:thiopurine S-methyltransferase-like isoform X1 n=1 Tax=Tachypleus tridentatus TaxID=6853 RepID=UPI003FD63A72